MRERGSLDRTLQRTGRILLVFIFIFAGSIFFTKDVNAAAFSNTQKEYINVLSRLMIEGSVSSNMDVYQSVSKGKSGKDCMRTAAISNRAALMAEGIDFLDSNWSQYYAVETKDGRTTFNSTKLLSRGRFRKRYKKIIKGLDEVLTSVDSSMNQADKAMAVYIYLAERTTYKESSDAHTGYDVLVNHLGVCDGLANAYALAMNTLGIPCAVVSNYSKNHSWNIVKLDGTWYFVDLTNGVGTGKHEGLVVSYQSVLVGQSTFLRTHPGYSRKDMYGQGNSDSLQLKRINLATSDYIKGEKELKNAIERKTCLFYHKGYWYWISQDNCLKKSNLRGNKVEVVYIPSSGQYIGWIRQYNEQIILSLNAGIYRMSFQKKHPVLLKKVDRRVSSAEVSAPLWNLIYIGRFVIDKNGYLSYYTSDFSGTRKGNLKVFLGKPAISSKTGRKGRQEIKIQAGRVKQLLANNFHEKAVDVTGWKSRNSSIVSIDSNGYMKARRAGKTYIYVKINGKRQKIRVKVYGYTITYKNAGINSAKNKTMVSGTSKVLLKKPKKKGYEFLGWYDKSGKNIKVIPKNNRKNIIVYAKWKKQ